MTSCQQAIDDILKQKKSKCEKLSVLKTMQATVLKTIKTTQDLLVQQF